MSMAQKAVYKLACKGAFQELCDAANIVIACGESPSSMAMLARVGNLQRACETFMAIRVEEEKL